MMALAFIVGQRRQRVTLGLECDHTSAVTVTFCVRTFVGHVLDEQGVRTEQVGQVVGWNWGE